MHLADLHASFGELGVGASTSATMSRMPCTEPGVALTIPFPRAIEHADPGGVSWMKRMSSLTAWSWSATKPAGSV